MAIPTKAHTLDHITTYKKLCIMTEYILHHDYEDHFVSFLKELQYDLEFQDFHQEINSLISEYEITDTEIQHTMEY